MFIQRWWKTLNFYLVWKIFCSLPIVKFQQLFLDWLIFNQSRPQDRCLFAENVYHISQLHLFCSNRAHLQSTLSTLYTNWEHLLIRSIPTENIYLLSKNVDFIEWCTCVVEHLSFLNCASDQYCRDGKKTTTLYKIENIAIVKIVNSQYLKGLLSFQHQFSITCKMKVIIL